MDWNAVCFSTEQYDVGDDHTPFHIIAISVLEKIT